MAQQEKASGNHPPGKGGREGFPDRPVVQVPMRYYWLLVAGIPLAIVVWLVAWLTPPRGLPPVYPYALGSTFLVAWTLTALALTARYVRRRRQREHPRHAP